jgi:hypothetical protein
MSTTTDIGQSESFRPYLKYLDKEMTIMGLLSSFSIAVIAGLLSTLKSLDEATLSGAMWAKATGPLGTGIVLLLVAAYFFYLQRAHLAWHFGYITYQVARHQPKQAMESLDELQGAKEEWRSYLHGLNLLAAGLVAVVGAFWYTRPSPPSSASWHFTLGTILALTLAGAVLEYRIHRDLIGFRRGHQRKRVQGRLSPQTDP